MANRRIFIDLQQGATTEDTVNNLVQQLIRLADQVDEAKIPISKGPNDELPEGLAVGHPVIDWSSGTSILKTWNGQTLV